MTIQETAISQLQKLTAEYAELYNKYMELPDGHKDLKLLREHIKKYEARITHCAMCACGYNPSEDGYKWHKGEKMV